MGKHNNIEFVSMVPGMPEEMYPQPSRLEYPDWFKDMPLLTQGMKKYDRGGTVKRCPSFVEWFGQGFILKMWSEVILQNDGKEWGWNTPDSRFSWDRHPANQFEDFLPHDKVNVVYKANCPIKVITPPGWSCYELPLLFDYNNDWQVMAGMNATDQFHEWNTTICLFGDKEEIFIPAGTPISQIVPFKRSGKLEPVYTEYEDLDRKTLKRMQKSMYKGWSKFTGSYKIPKS